MAESPLMKRLQIKPGQKIAVIDAPEGFVEGIGHLPPGAKLVEKLEEALDFVQLFVKNSQELESSVTAVLRALKKDGLLWICYPKGSSKVKTDLNRDILWKKMEKYGQAGVAMISVDAVWSAMRFRPTEKVGK
ncbi:MAG: hypothetical protein HY665_09390 [Chloroflexi bacterium]|nr:hypothetical protein [Chloroflexota bacterium]